MLRATNEAQSDYTAQAIHAFALVDTSDLPQRQNLGRDHSSSEAYTTASIVYSRGGLAPRVVRRVREHIEGNIEKRISVEALARVANLSVCYFVRAFKQSVGVTPHDYLIRRRVERTMQLLSGTDMSLSEIALAAGFADQSHCARRFRQHVGMSPRDYRWSRP
jgi:AraC family transcriptional regulator